MYKAHIKFSLTIFHNYFFFSFDISMTFPEDYDTVVTDIGSFTNSVRNSLVSRYGSTHNLKESQISDVKVSRGSIVVVVTLEDSKELEQSANVTILLIQMEQDVSDNIIEYTCTCTKVNVVLPSPSLSLSPVCIIIADHHT